jgi:succinyl-CoA synthetase beta subunit
MTRMTYTKVSLNFGLGTPDGVVVDEGVSVEDANEVYIGEKVDVAVGMVLLTAPEELGMSVESVEETDGPDGALVASG